MAEPVENQQENEPSLIDELESAHGLPIGDAPEEKSAAPEASGDGDVEEEVPAAPEPDAGEKSHRVPLAELLEERRARRETERQLNDLRAMFAAEKVRRDNEARAAQEAAKKPAKPKINFEDSPVDHLKQELDETKETLEQERTRREAEEAKAKQQQQIREQITNFTTGLRRVEEEFAAKNGDYYEALAYLRDIERARYSELGLTDSEIEQALPQQELQNALAIVQRNKNPAEYSYNLAKRLGYKPAQKTVENSGKGKPNTSEDDALAARKAAAAKNPKASGLPSEETLQEMDEDEFQTAFNSVFRPRKK